MTFGVSSQHYTFTENAFVELVKRFGQERYAFYYNETGTHQILDDVKNRVCDLGILQQSLMFFCKKITHWHRKK